MYVLIHFRPEPAFLAGKQKSSLISASRALRGTPAGPTHLNFFSFYFNMFRGHVFWIRGGGETALLLAKPAASGDAGASPRGGRKKMRPPRERRERLAFSAA
jgi:hypothetical protein